MIHITDLGNNNMDQSPVVQSIVRLTSSLTGQLVKCCTPLLPNTHEPVSVKTGLNNIEMKINKTALRESISFSECFLKI